MSDDVTGLEIGRVCANDSGHKTMMGWYTIDGRTLCDSCGDAELAARDKQSEDGDIHRRAS